MRSIQQLWGLIKAPAKSLGKALFKKTQARHLYPEFNFKVYVTDEGVRLVRPDGKEESVAWNSLKTVIIETSDTGPWGADVLWALVCEDGKVGCVIPQGADGEEPLLKRLQALPGFSNEALIEAMGSTSNRKFLCWERVGGSGVIPNRLCH